MKLFPPPNGVLHVGGCARRSPLPHPLGMAEGLDEGPSSALKRGPAKSVRRVKRTKRKATCNNSRRQQETESEVNHDAGRVELAPPTKKLVHYPSLAADIQRTFSKALEWMLGVPTHFWLAVFGPRMLVQLFRECWWRVDPRGVDGHVVKPSAREVIKGLVRWLQNLLPKESPDVVYKFLIATGLHEVVEAYLDLLLHTSRLELRFSVADFLKDDQPFDPGIHSEANEEGGLRPGDLCILVLPATTMWGGASGLFKVVSKGFVLPKQEPEEVESLRQEILR